MSHLNYYIEFPLFFLPWGFCLLVFLFCRWNPGLRECQVSMLLWGHPHWSICCATQGHFEGRVRWEIFFLNFHPPHLYCNWKLKNSSLQNPVLVQNLSFEDHCFFSGTFHVVGIAFLRRKSAWASWMCFSENQGKKIPLHLSDHTRWGVHLLFSFRGRLFRWSQ